MVALGQDLTLGNDLRFFDVFLPGEVHDGAVLVVFLLHSAQELVDLTGLRPQELGPKMLNEGLSKETEALRVLGLIEEVEKDWPDLGVEPADKIFDFWNQFLAPRDAVRVDKHQQGHLVVLLARKFWGNVKCASKEETLLAEGLRVDALVLFGR